MNFIKDKFNKKINNKSRDNNIQKNFDGDNTGNQELVNCLGSQPILVQGENTNSKYTKNKAI